MGYTKATRKFGAGELLLFPLQKSYAVENGLAFTASDNDGTNLGVNAYDGNEATYWASSAVVGYHTLLLDLGADTAINSNVVVLFKAATINSMNSVQTIYFQHKTAAAGSYTTATYWSSYNVVPPLWSGYHILALDVTARYFLFNLYPRDPSGELRIEELIFGIGTGVFSNVSNGEIPFSLLRAIKTGAVGIDPYSDDGMPTLGTVNSITATVGGIDITAEAETFADEIDQEQSPVQTIVAGASGFLEFGIPMGDPQLLALAAGLTGATAETDILGTDDDADTVILGARQPQEFSILHRCLNPHNTSFYDYVYIPRAAVIPAPTLNFSRKGPRDHRVRFALLPSVQTGMQVNGMGALFKVIHQNAT